MLDAAGLQTAANGAPDTPPGDLSTPLAGVTLHLYGRNAGEPEPGGFLKTTVSDLAGFFNFHVIQPWVYDIFTLVAETPAGMVPLGVWSEDGTVLDKQRVEWHMAAAEVHENVFYFETPTIAPADPITETITLPLQHDTWVTWGDEHGNYDAYAALIARTSGLNNILLRFGRSALPQNARIFSAKLQVHVSGQSGALGKSLAVLNVTPFTPAAVTYAVQNAELLLYNPSAAVSVPLAPGPLSFDVTEQVKSWDDPLFTSYHRGYLALSASGPFGRIILDSLETTAGSPATLTVTYTTAP